MYLQVVWVFSNPTYIRQRDTIGRLAYKATKGPVKYEVSE